jgi:hypothetical protein
VRLAFALLLTVVACGSDADHAARRANAFLRRADPGETYRRLCQTRLGDGYVITYGLLPRPNIGYFDRSPWPVVVVPDSGAPWIARETFTREGANGSEPEPPSPEQLPPLDSTNAMRLALVTAGPTMRVHCYIALHRAGGAFVQMLGRASSAKGPTLGGVVMGVGDDGRTNTVFTF